MRFYLTMTLLIFGSISLHAQNTECLQKMKTGNFKYLDKREGTTIVRRGNKQIEYSKNKKSKLKLKVKWLNDSTYVLTHKKTVRNPGCLEKGTQIKVQIISCDGNKYFAKYESETCGNGESWFLKIK